MTLYEQIKEDIKVAMRGKDMKTLDVLRMVAASIKNKAIDLKREVEEEDVLSVVKSDMKKLQDALQDFTKAAREDLMEKTREEIEILKKYLPEEMSDEALEEAVRDIFKKHKFEDASQMGQAMGVVMKELQGKVSGNRVRPMVEQVLKK